MLTPFRSWPRRQKFLLNQNFVYSVNVPKKMNTSWQFTQSYIGDLNGILLLAFWSFRLWFFWFSVFRPSVHAFSVFWYLRSFFHGLLTFGLPGFGLSVPRSFRIRSFSFRPISIRSSGTFGLLDSVYLASVFPVRSFGFGLWTGYQYFDLQSRSTRTNEIKENDCM